jgi:hypothetical protein
MQPKHKAMAHKDERELGIVFHPSFAKGTDWLRDRRALQP